jgi:glycosyltransferase involved in cell wall biosynthesis
MRGFWADEKHDRLNWNKKSYKYVFFKRLEKYLIDNSQKIITLTEASKDIMIQNFNAPNSLIEVIPTCVDFNEFHRVQNVSRNNFLTIGYLGSIDTAYDFSKFSILISQLQNSFKNKIHLKVLTNKTLQEVTKFIPEGTLSKIKLEVKFVQRDELSKEISSFDFLGFYLKENFSINASMPTKIGESLACGVPIICNSFNSDIRNIIETHDVGIIYDFKKSLSDHQIKKLYQILEEKTVHRRCLKIVNEYFSLEKGASTYNDLYSELISKY